MTEHAPPPAICPACLAAVLESGKGSAHRVTWLHCGHLGGASLRAEFLGGRAVHYALLGPEDEAAYQHRTDSENAAIDAALARPPGALDH